MLLGSQIAGHFGEFWALLLATAGGVAGLIVMSQVKEQRPTGEPMTVKGFLEVAKNRELITGTVLATVYQLVVWATVQGFVQNWARDVIGFTTAQLGYLSVANLLPNTILARLSGTVFAPKFGRKTVLVGGFVFIAAACFLYPYTRSLVSLLAVQALLGAGVGLIVPLTMASAVETIPNAKRGAAMGIYQAIYGLGMFLGPVIAGAVIERFSGGAATDTIPVQGYIANFYVAMAMALAGGVLALIFTSNKKKS
jgi:MFS family permease